MLPLILLAGCRKKSPYSILNREEKGPGGVVVLIRAEVPAQATKEQMTGWCADITKSEAQGKAVTIDFMVKDGVLRQRAVCANGVIYPGPAMNPVQVSPPAAKKAAAPAKPAPTG